MKEIVVSIIFLVLFLFGNTGAAYEEITTKQKQKFIHKIGKAVAEENESILSSREKLLIAFDKWLLGQPLSIDEINWVDNLAQEYGVDDNNDNEFSVQEWLLLIRRVDIIPPSLAVAQAINESAWGRSRFAVEANNYYGQWCYSKGCGLVPRDREEGATHEVKKFSSLDASVASYIKNLNTHDTYRDFRIEREKLRAEDKDITGLELLPYLNGYSQIGSDYNKYIHAIITSNNLQRLNK